MHQNDSGAENVTMLFTTVFFYIKKKKYIYTYTWGPGIYILYPAGNLKI